MHILLIAATPWEIRLLTNHFTFIGRKNEYLEQYQVKQTRIDVLIPGIGMLATAFHLGRQLLRTKYDFAINAGICGSFSQDIQIGKVVEITEDCVSELGAENRDEFLSIFELGLMDPDEPPYHSGKLVNTIPISSPTINKLPKVQGITVNKAHGNKESIEMVKLNFSPQTESMEGAAFLFGCLLEEIPNTQIRAVSNYVVERDRAKWNLDLACKNLNNTLISTILEIAE